MDIPGCFQPYDEDTDILGYGDKFCDFRYAKMCAFTRTVKNKDIFINMIVSYINRFKVYLDDTREIVEVGYNDGKPCVYKVYNIKDGLNDTGIGNVGGRISMMKVWFINRPRVNTMEEVLTHFKTLEKS